MINKSSLFKEEQGLHLLSLALSLQILEFFLLLILELEVLLKFIHGLAQIVVVNFEVVLSLGLEVLHFLKLLADVLTHQIDLIAFTLVISLWRVYTQDRAIRTRYDKLLFHKDFITCEVIGLSNRIFGHIIDQANAVKCVTWLNLVN